ncbi:hypothetical protein M8J77_005903 [Diaphorina citri]|nr:hypothetical protein M8J77_005903 [Diaphorina citri]
MWIERRLLAVLVTVILVTMVARPWAEATSKKAEATSDSRSLERWILAKGEKYVAPNPLPYLTEDRVQNFTIDEELKRQVDEKIVAQFRRLQFELVKNETDPHKSDPKAYNFESETVTDNDTDTLCYTGHPDGPNKEAQVYGSQARCQPNFCFLFKTELEENNLDGICKLDTKLFTNMFRVVKSYTRCVQVVARKPDGKCLPQLSAGKEYRDACLCVFDDRIWNDVVSYLLYEDNNKKGVVNYLRYLDEQVPSEKSENDARKLMETWFGDDAFRKPTKLKMINVGRFQKLFVTNQKSDCEAGIMKIGHHEVDTIHN